MGIVETFLIHFSYISAMMSQLGDIDDLALHLSDSPEAEAPVDAGIPISLKIGIPISANIPALRI